MIEPSLLRELASVCYADAGDASDQGDFEECDRLLELAGELHERAEKTSGNALPPSASRSGVAPTVNGALLLARGAA